MCPFFFSFLSLFFTHPFSLSFLFASSSRDDGTSSIIKGSNDFNCEVGTAFFAHRGRGKGRGTVCVWSGTPKEQGEGGCSVSGAVFLAYRHSLSFRFWRDRATLAPHDTKDYQCMCGTASCSRPFFSAWCETTVRASLVLSEPVNLGGGGRQPNECAAPCM